MGIYGPSGSRLDLNPENTGDRHHRNMVLARTKRDRGLETDPKSVTYYQAIGFHNNPDTNIRCQFPKTDIFQCRTFYYKTKQFS